MFWFGFVWFVVFGLVLVVFFVFLPVVPALQGSACRRGTRGAPEAALTAVLPQGRCWPSTYTQRAGPGGAGGAGGRGAAGALRGAETRRCRCLWAEAARERHPRLRSTNF